MEHPVLVNPVAEPSDVLVGEGIASSRARTGKPPIVWWLVFGGLAAWLLSHALAADTWASAVPAALGFLVVGWVIAVPLGVQARVHVCLWDRRNPSRMWSRFELADSGITQHWRRDANAETHVYEWFLFESYSNDEYRLTLTFRVPTPGGGQVLLIPAEHFGDDYPEVIHRVAAKVKPLLPKQPTPEPRASSYRSLALWIVIVLLCWAVYRMANPR